MAANNRIRVMNVEDDEYVSMILREVERIISSGYDDRIIVEDIVRSSSNTKDLMFLEMVIELAEDVGIAIIGTLIKDAFKKFSKVKGQDRNLKKTIELEYTKGDEIIKIKIEEFINKED